LIILLVSYHFSVVEVY